MTEYLFSCRLRLLRLALFFLQLKNIVCAVFAFPDFGVVSPAGNLLQGVLHFLADFPEVSGSVRHLDPHPFRFAVVQREPSDRFPEEVFFPDFDFMPVPAGCEDPCGYHDAEIPSGRRLSEPYH